MQKVTIYSQNSCASCMMVKKWLTIKKVGYTEVNLDEQPDKREHAMKISGSATVPVVVIENTDNNQKTISVGYKPAQLSTVLAN